MRCSRHGIGGRMKVILNGELVDLTLSIRDTSTKLLKHFISRTFTFLLSALFKPHASATYNAVGTITPSYRHFLGFIPSPLLLSTLFSDPHALYHSFILCATTLSHPPSAATCDPRYLKQSTCSCVLSDRPLVLRWLSPGEGLDAVT